MGKTEIFFLEWNIFERNHGSGKQINRNHGSDTASLIMCLDLGQID